MNWEFIVRTMSGGDKIRFLAEFKVWINKILIELVGSFVLVLISILNFKSFKVFGKGKEEANSS